MSKLRLRQNRSQGPVSLQGLGCLAHRLYGEGGCYGARRRTNAEFSPEFLAPAAALLHSLGSERKILELRLSSGGACVAFSVMRTESSRPDRGPLSFYAGFIAAIAVVVLIGAYAFTGDFSGLASVGGPGR